MLTSSAGHELNVHAKAPLGPPAPPPPLLGSWEERPLAEEQGPRRPAAFPVKSQGLSSAIFHLHTPTRGVHSCHPAFPSAQSLQPQEGLPGGCGAGCALCSSTPHGPHLGTAPSLKPSARGHQLVSEAFSQLGEAGTCCFLCVLCTSTVLAQNRPSVSI